MFYLAQIDKSAFFGRFYEISNASKMQISVLFLRFQTIFRDLSSFKTIFPVVAVAFPVYSMPRRLVRVLQVFTLKNSFAKIGAKKETRPKRVSEHAKERESPPKKAGDSLKAIPRNPDGAITKSIFFVRRYKNSQAVARLQARIFVKYDGKSASECANRGLRGVALRQHRARCAVTTARGHVGHR